MLYNESNFTNIKQRSAKSNKDFIASILSCLLAKIGCVRENVVRLARSSHSLPEGTFRVADIILCQAMPPCCVPIKAMNASCCVHDYLSSPYSLKFAHIPSLRKDQWILKTYYVDEAVDYFHY